MLYLIIINYYIKTKFFKYININIQNLIRIKINKIIRFIKNFL